MFDKYAEHLRDSQPDNSRFDGFDRGDLGRNDPCDSYMTYTPEQEAALDAWVIAYRKADKELIKQYRYMQRIFAQARRALDRADTPQHKRRVLRALGEAALAEHAEWTLMHRGRPLERARI